MLPHTMDPVWAFITWSLNCCYNGRNPMFGVDGQLWVGDPRYLTGQDIGFRCRLWELRGDWKWHHQCFGLKSTWMSDAVCHICRATKSRPGQPSYVDFRAQPAWLPTCRTHAAFIQEQLPQDRPCNTLCYNFGFDYKCIRLCTMHVCNLGIGLFANGGAFHELLEHQVFDGETMTEKFLRAYRMFKTWCSTNNISCSQSTFKPYMLVTSKGEDYCFFQTKDPNLQYIIMLSCFIMYPKTWKSLFKDIMRISHEAHNGRVLTSWLASICSEEFRKQGGERLRLTAETMYHLHLWYTKTELCGRYLSNEDLDN